MRDYSKETEKRVEFIKKCVENSGADGIVYGNSGGKDSALVGILCKMACGNTVGIIMPCESSRNFGQDMKDGLEVAEKFGIETRVADLTGIKKSFAETLSGIAKINTKASVNINPRIRMTMLYSVAACENRLVAGTGNKSEGYMGYFTKWGDGAYDFNPIADLTVTEIYDFLKYLGAPDCVISKAPSAGLFDGQTDEGEMGISYSDIDEFLLCGKASKENLEILNRFHKASEHKRKMPLCFDDET